MNNKQHFAESGYRRFINIVHPDELDSLRSQCDAYYDAANVSAESDEVLPNKKVKLKKEGKINTLKAPMALSDTLDGTKTFLKVVKIAGELFDTDMETSTATFFKTDAAEKKNSGWHQDAVYDPKKPDNKTISFYIALDDISLESGAMMYLHGSHRQVQKTKKAKDSVPTTGAAVIDSDGIVYGAMPAGAAMVHHGSTLYAFADSESVIKPGRFLVVQLRTKGKTVHS